MAASIDGLFIAAEAGAPMTEVASAELVAGRGIVGDRYCRRQGTYSVFRQSLKSPGAREPGRARWAHICNVVVVL